MEHDRAVAELEALIETLEREGDERALLLLELVDAVHRPGLQRLAAGEREHPDARALLAAYGLVEPDPELLAEEALDEIRPYVESHGGAVELVAVDGGRVTVRMSGACHGCAASAMTLRRGIETALRERMAGFEEVVAVEPEGGNGAPAPELLQIEGVEVKQPVFVDLLAAGETAEEGLRAVQADGIPVLVVSTDGDHYAFVDRCPVDGRSLAGGRLADSGGPVVVCPWHNCAYDARSGKRIDEPEATGLQVVPLALRDGRIQVAVNVA